MLKVDVFYVYQALSLKLKPLFYTSKFHVSLVIYAIS